MAGAVSGPGVLSPFVDGLTSSTTLLARLLPAAVPLAAAATAAYSSIGGGRGAKSVVVPTTAASVELSFAWQGAGRLMATAATSLAGLPRTCQSRSWVPTVGKGVDHDAVVLNIGPNCTPLGKGHE
ncbi:hypothetical protein EV182_001595 [Spiromyces aspiralis]|uniref:Uncharacterized protein n=1 Tax=Spiromyces aspiralis TaxID=68401 RepID=A0ACC1I0J2_9FUNG|nr:hypothetical protein EV182_001595 [Spiromyces aspiralis]